MRKTITKRGRAAAKAPAPRTRAAAVKALEPAVAASQLAPISGVSGATMGFMDSSEGNGRPSLTWARYHTPHMVAGYGPWFGAPGSEISQERALAASVTQDLLTQNSTISTLVENAATYAIGNGLTLSSRPNAEVLGISTEAARELSHQIESAWHLWANSAACDASQRHTLHQLAVAAYKSWLISGEALVSFDWLADGNGATTKTKVRLLDSRQLDQSITRTTTDGGSILQGVQFDKIGRVVGYWIRPYVLGNYSAVPQPIFVAARTSWGRPRMLHIFDLIVPGQIRGLSPLIAALSPSHAKGTLREFALASALVQTMTATTIESDMPTRQALDQFAVNDPLQGYNVAPVTPDGTSLAAPGSPEAWLKGRAEFYGEARVQLQPGVVSHLAQGDKLKMHRAETPNATYDSFDKSLGRESAKAAGSSYEDMSGDYSQTSFSASRLAMELPSRINQRRRLAIAIPFYRAAFRAWLEEQIETGRIQLPAGAPDFWKATDAYCAAEWRGAGKPTSDPLKQAQADVLELEHGLATYESKLAERGYDLEEIISQRKSEREQLEAAGLPYPTPKTSVIDTSEDDDEDEALK